MLTVQLVQQHPAATFTGVTVNATITANILTDGTAQSSGAPTGATTGDFSGNVTIGGNNTITGAMNPVSGNYKQCNSWWYTSSNRNKHLLVQ